LLPSNQRCCSFNYSLATGLAHSCSSTPIIVRNLPILLFRVMQSCQNPCPLHPPILKEACKVSCPLVFYLTAYNIVFKRQRLCQLCMSKCSRVYTKYCICFWQEVLIYSVFIQLQNQLLRQLKPRLLFV